ncbi:uncharacterized protein LOC101168175 [Oryzias latipes]|uniref:uncharacterized protein LOC101168175 n=1 Tax=Oryzias latipes TaxID=8090 RepID=UPI0000EA1F27|nr:uncharacterized protein LOC101168175 [Oryzias latipes]
MEFVPNQNLTSGSQPEVKAWDSAAQPVIAVNRSIVVLAALTFVLQLCLVLFLLLRCWRLDSRAREALQQPDSLKKPSEHKFFPPHVYKPPTFSQYDDPAGAPWPPLVPAEKDPPAHSLCAHPPRHWDLIQSGWSPDSRVWL